MRRNLIAIVILAGVVSGCTSTNASSPGSMRNSALNLDPDRPRSCYGGPVYVPC